jgi:hypothetical protein
MDGKCQPYALVGDAAAAVQMGATKVQLLFSDGNGLPLEAAESALKDFHMNVITFVAYAQSAMGTEGRVGTYLRPKTRPTDDSRYVPCNQSDTAREWQL